MPRLRTANFPVIAELGAHELRAAAAVGHGCRLAACSLVRARCRAGAPTRDAATQKAAKHGARQLPSSLRPATRRSRCEVRCCCAVLRCAGLSCAGPRVNNMTSSSHGQVERTRGSQSLALVGGCAGCICGHRAGWGAVTAAVARRSFSQPASDERARPAPHGCCHPRAGGDG